MNEANSRPSGQFREACCVDAMRIFDSCSSQDCLEDLQFSFASSDQQLIDQAAYIKTQSIDVTDVDFVITPVAFNKGFYSVDVTYNFRAQIEVYEGDSTPPDVVYGTASFTKKVILFGSDGGTQRFDSVVGSASVNEPQSSGCACCNSLCTLPTASVNIASPMCLDTKLGSYAPQSGCQSAQNERGVYITIGIFAIISLSRPVPLMVPVYDYCVPGRECDPTTDGSPCQMFESIDFPTNEFFPRGLDTSCGCDNNTADTQPKNDKRK